MPELRLPDRCKISIAGRLVRDAETKTSKRGHTFATFTIARNVYTRGNEDTTEHQEKTIFFECRAFGIMADRAKSLRKGHSVQVDGDFDLAHYHTAKGERRERLDVKVDDVQLLEWPNPDRLKVSDKVDLSAPIDDDEDPLI